MAESAQQYRTALPAARLRTPYASTKLVGHLRGGTQQGVSVKAIVDIATDVVPTRSLPAGILFMSTREMRTVLCDESGKWRTTQADRLPWYMHALHHSISHYPYSVRRGLGYLLHSGRSVLGLGGRKSSGTTAGMTAPAGPRPRLVHMISRVPCR